MGDTPGQLGLTSGSWHYYLTIQILGMRFFSSLWFYFVNYSWKMALHFDLNIGMPFFFYLFFSSSFWFPMNQHLLKWQCMQCRAEEYFNPIINMNVTYLRCYLIFQIAGMFIFFLMLLSHG